MVDTKYYIINAELISNNETETVEIYRELITVDTDFRKVFDIYTQYIWNIEVEYFKTFISISLIFENEKGIQKTDYKTFFS